MKNLLLLAGLWLCCTAAYAQSGTAGKAQVAVNLQYSGNDTTRTFSIFGPDQEKLLQKIKEAFGTPASDKTGMVTWNNIPVNNMAAKLNVHLTDGILYMERDAIFGPFSSNEDKRARLAGLKKGETRVIEIEFRNVAGVNAIDSKKKEDLVKDFLQGIIGKS